MADDGSRAHLLFSWNPDYGALTVEEHLAVAENGDGSVWWGRFNRTGTTRAAIEGRKLAAIQARIASGERVRAFFRHSGSDAGLSPIGRSDWSADVIAITNKPDDVDVDRLPTYYKPEQCNLFVLVHNWEDLGEGWVLQNLEFANPELTLTPKSLGTQTNPNQVVLRHASILERKSEIAEALEAFNEAAGKTIARGQGRGLSAPERKALEDHSMAWARKHYEQDWPTVTDTSKGNPYDLHCKGPGGTELYVEVKGTTTAGEAVLVTPGEVNWMRGKLPDTALFVVSHVTLTNGAAGPECAGGEARELRPWDPAEERLKATGYTFTLPTP